MELTQLDLCSGVGVGFPLAGEMLQQFYLMGLCERDSWCREILSKRFPGVSIYSDVRRRENWSHALPIKGRLPDIITASPNCQPFSVQGQRLGAADERDCFPAVLEAISILRPKFFCIENVPGLLSCPLRPKEPSGSYFRHVLQFLSAIGFNVEWLCVSSGHFSSPFLRTRLLLVGVGRSLISQGREQPTSWAEQVGSFLEKTTGSQTRAVLKSSPSRSLDEYSRGMGEPLGIPTGDGIIRKQRKALGNALDPNVAAVGLRRILYLNSLGRRSQLASPRGW